MPKQNGQSDKEIQNMGDAVRAMIIAQPFEEFLIKLADGDTIRVIHPDYAIVSPNRRQVLAYEKDGHLRIINLRLATTVEPVRAAPKKRVKR